MRRIWRWGPNGNGPNVLFNMAQEGHHLNQVKDYVICGFDVGTLTGALCEEPLRGVRFNLIDVEQGGEVWRRALHQVIPMTRKALLAAQLASRPRLMEPIYLLNVWAHRREDLPAICAALSERRGHVLPSGETAAGCEDYTGHTARTTSTQPLMIEAYLPVAEHSGFVHALSAVTGMRLLPCVVTL
jgi:elongation factor 2